MQGGCGLQQDWRHAQGLLAGSKEDSLHGSKLAAMAAMKPIQLVHWHTLPSQHIVLERTVLVAVVYCCAMAYLAVVGP